MNDDNKLKDAIQKVGTDGFINALVSQRNNAMDALAEANGRLAAAAHEVRELHERLKALEEAKTL